MLMIGDTIGGTLGLLMIVNIFRMLAGVKFNHWRHIASAYGAGCLFAVAAITAQGSAGAGAYLLGLPFALLFEMAWLYRRALPASTKQSKV